MVLLDHPARDRRRPCDDAGWLGTRTTWRTGGWAAMLGPVAELKTKPTGDDVEAFLQSVAETVRSDCRELVMIMRAATGADPVMWGSSIVGFGSVHYRYASGREGDWFRVGFSPRKRNVTLYLADGVDSHAEQLQRLGTYSAGKGCLYIKRLDDVDQGVLVELINNAASTHE